MPLSPEAPVHAFFERWARETPGAPAVESADLSLTYGELNRRANQLAHHLRRLGVGPEVIVALRLERSPELVLGALATLKAGGAWLPVDPAHPAERLDYVLRDSGAALLLTVERLALPGLPVEALALDVLDLSGESGDDPEPLPGLGPAQPGQLAYVIYTSGSTGVPKGVELRHRGLSSLAAWDRDWFGRGPADRCTLAAGPGFDASVWEMWSALTAGASLHVPPADVLVSPPALWAWIRERRITLAFLPTPLAELALAEWEPDQHPQGLALRVLQVGGDRLRRRPAPEHPFRVANLYGPTECAVISAASWVCPGGERAPDVGPPITSARAYVLDSDLLPVPAGEPGELCIAGEGLARAYRGRPELTAAAFVPDPFGSPGTRLYRTGDLARWLPQGDIDVLGRIDHQVKVRGFRIELGEIEAALARHPPVREAVVLAREGEDRLSAYVVLREELPAAREALRGFLAATLPEYMLPTAWAFLEALPLTPNGKVDRRALARIEPAAGPEGESAAAPRTQLEELIAGLFAQVLGLDRPVGLHEDFFQLGGHSLLATRLASRVREVCGVDLGMRSVFERPTVAALAARIDEASRELRPVAPPLEPLPAAARAAGLPLSFAQQRLWFLDSLRPGTALYNLTQACDLAGDLSVPALAAALAGIVARHEALRTTFVPPAGGGEPLQAIAPPATLPLTVIDLAGLPEPRQRSETGRLTAEEARRPYDLERGPLLRAALLRRDGADHRLLLGMHHIVSDGWSAGVLLAELSALYRAEPLAPLAIQYPDYAVWQRRWLAGDVLESQLAWWRERLAGAPAVLELPADRPRPVLASLRGAVERLPLGAGLETGLAALSRRSGATLFMTLLAAFQALLHRYTGQEDLVVGSPVANRGRTELEPLIGFFVNMVALRADLADEPAFADLLADAREAALGAYAHQDLPFERLVEELVPGRDLAHAPIFQIALALQDALPGPDLGPGMTTSAIEVPSGTAKLDLTLFVERGPGGLTALAEHATDLFDGATVQRLLGCFRTLLAGVVADPAARVAELLLLSREEMEQIAASADPGAIEVPAVPVHRLFEAQVDRAPEALAVARGAERLTYAELDARANRLARRLRRLGVGPECVVAILLERSPELLVAVLGTLKAGGAWLPIDPAYPAERVLYTLADSAACALLSAGGPLAVLPEVPLPAERIVRLDTDVLTPASTESGARPSPGPDPGPDRLAYVIYTSGSTGRPKGTELRHGGLANLLAWYGTAHRLDPRDRCSLIAGPGFDASVWEMWSPLAAGASIHIPPREAVLAPVELLTWLADQEITVAFLPTPLAEAALAQPLPARLALRALMIGGDRLNRRPPASLPFPLVNLYGPAEATVVSTSATVSPAGARAPEVGTAIANVRAHLLDRALQPVPDGVPGELCIAGAGLARCYLGRPGLTAERFVPHPLAGGAGERLYRTGDLARRLPDGQIELLGRLDQQVKIRGVRIELGEIESAIAACPGVGAAAVLAREDGSGDKRGDRRLVAYVAALGGSGAEELRAQLARRLPAAMLPAAWVFLDEMPLTPNGKVDRRALERIAPPERESAGALEAPRNPVEELLAGLFAEVLELDRAVGIHEDFFRLGGHSLLAVQLASRARAALGTALDVLAVFERPTVAGLAARIAAAGLAAAPPITPSGSRGEAPLSFAQERLWFLDRFESGTALYNMPVVFHLQGPGLSVPALAGALDEVVRRHEVLRAVFRETEGGDSVQAVQPLAPRGLPVVDLAGLPDAAAEAAWLHGQTAEMPFDLERGPLLRSLLLRLSGDEHHLLVTMHHIASDGWSFEVLVRELSGIYRAFAAGRPHSLPPLAVQYADFAVWQREWLAGETLAGELAWWRERLAGIPDGLELPADRPRPAVRSLRGAVRCARIEPRVVAGLAALSRRQGATLFMTLMAAFQALLYLLTGEVDLVVGTPVANRGAVELEGLIGFFVNTLVLRTPLAGDPGFRELLARVRAAALAAYAHQDLPFEQLVAELGVQRDLSRTPVFQVVLSLQETPPPVLDLGPGLRAPLSEVRTATAKFDLSLQLYREGDGMEVLAEYAADLFDAATVDRFLGNLETLLAGIVAAPRTRLSELPLLSAEERAQLQTGAAPRRQAGPASGPQGAGGAAGEPRTEVERALAEIWRELLQVDRAGLRDDFFHLGGHSLLGMRLASQVRRRLGVELPLRTLFEEPTLGGLAARIEDLRRQSRTALGEPESALPGDPAPAAPLSFGQQRLWFLDRLQPGLAVYNIPLVFAVEGPLAAGALEAALTEVVRRHGALRTTFALDPGSGDPVQVVGPPAPHRLACVDLAGVAGPLRRTEAERLVAGERRRPFDLERGPLLRSLLVRLGARESRLVLSMHHIVSDGWSVGVLLHELRELYGAFAAGRPSPLPELPTQYADFAAWQRRWLAGEELESRLRWWRARLAGTPPALDLPADHPRPPVQSLRGGQERRSLGAGLREGVERLGRARGTTPFMTLLAGFAALLHRYTGEEDLWLGTPIANRTRSETEGLIGFFVNTLVLRTSLEGEPAYAELLARVRETALSAYAHQDLPFEKLVEELAPARDLSRSPLFQVLFSVQNEWTGQVELAPGLTLVRQPDGNGTAKLDLSVTLWTEPGGALMAGAEHSADLFEPATAQRLLGHLGALLASAVAAPEARISDLPLLTAEEHDQVVSGWNRTEAAVPDAPVHVLFAEQARRAPERPAVVWQDGQISYGELDRRANQLAHHLRRLGVGPERIVALRLERSPELVLAALATLKAGGAWLPIDPALPAERLDFLLRDSGASLLLTPERLAGLDLSAESEDDPGLPAAGTGQLAYVIYTSGSTGTPKGIELRHRGLANLAAWTRRTFGLGPDDRSTLIAGPGFDASVWEMWLALTAGMSLHIPPPDLVAAPSALLGWLAGQAITTAFLPTPLAEAVLAEPLPPGLALRVLWTGGDRLRRRPPVELPCPLVNLYGPTECTVVTTAGLVYPQGDRAPAIGGPIANTRNLLLDRALRPVPVGVAGELCVAGEGLARGYRGRPGLTAERFVPDPFGVEVPGSLRSEQATGSDEGAHTKERRRTAGTPRGERLYRTGDLARRLPDGRIEILGRIDHQVKIRGYRIELAEIEAALQELPGVQAAVVVAREGRPGEQQLVGYLVPRGTEVAVPELRQALAQRLPEYMVPAAFVVLESLPLTANGKVDRRALPAPQDSRPEAAFVAPRTPLEEQIAAIWQEILHVDRIGLHDSFWDLGGHSLLATKALARVNEAFGVTLPLRSLFAGPTLGELAGAVGQSVLDAQGEDVAGFLADLDGLSDEEIQALLAAESELQELT